LTIKNVLKYTSTSDTTNTAERQVVAVSNMQVNIYSEKI